MGAVANEPASSVTTRMRSPSPRLSCPRAMTRLATVRPPPLTSTIPPVPILPVFTSVLPRHLIRQIRQPYK